MLPNYLRAQIAKLRNELVKIASSKKGGGGGFGIKKTGDAQVAFIGFPSVGKSSLLNLLTEGDTESKVASYEFTTINAIPGMMNIEEAKIQLIDLPGIILGAATGKGRGREILGAARSAELILIIIGFREDGTINFGDRDFIRNELGNAGIRVSQQPARIQIKTRNRGGIGFTYNGHQIMSHSEVKGIMNEMGHSNAGVYFYQPDVTPQQLIDNILGNRVYTNEYVVINKSDLEKTRIPDASITKKLGHDHWMRISALNNNKIRELQHQIFLELSLIRVYLKPPGEEADMDEPIILHEGDDIEVLCRKLHKSFLRNYRFCMIWGKSAKHPVQKFHKMDHILEDGDLVTIYLKR